MNFDKVRSIQYQQAILRSSYAHLTHMAGSFKKKICLLCNWSFTSFYIKAVQVPGSVSIADNIVAGIIFEKLIQDLAKIVNVAHKDIKWPIDTSTYIDLDVSYPKYMIFHIYNGIGTIKDYFKHRIKEDLNLTEKEFLYFKHSTMGKNNSYFFKDIPQDYQGVCRAILLEIVTQLYFLKEYARSTKNKKHFVIEEIRPIIASQANMSASRKLFKAKKKPVYVKRYSCSMSKQ